MSLEKTIKIDQIEIVGDYKAIQVRNGNRCNRGRR